MSYRSKSSASGSTCSMFSNKDSFSVQDSRLGVNEMQELKAENQEFKLDIGKLQSELLAMLQTNEDRKAMIEKKKICRRPGIKLKMFVDHSSSLLYRCKNCLKGNNCWNISWGGENSS